MAGVSFGVLGNGETCTGDQARRAGNEFVFQGLAQQNVETFKEYKVKKVVSTCAHCFNTLKNEYKEFGIELEVIHHTQLLNRLVREGKLTPVKEGEGAAKRSITYHDPCYIGRHNGVYTPPRELLQVLPGAEVVEMERNSERSFCCGAGGARMWMEENIGERINVNRTNEAVGTGADQIAVGCPFCRVMLSDGLTAQQAKGEAREEVEVLDVAQMLLASVKGESATKLKPGGAPAPSAKKKDVATKAEPEADDETRTAATVTETEEVGPAAKASASAGSAGAGGTSLFDTPAEPESTEAEPEPTQPAASTGGSLFDLGAEEAPQAEAEAQAPAPQAAEPAATTTDLGSGGSLFDLAAEPEAPQAKTAAEPEPKAETPAPKPKAAPAAPTTDLGSGGSLFDLEPPVEETPAAKAEPAPEAPEPAAEPEPATEAQAEPAPPAPAKSTPAAAPAAEIPQGGSLFDIAAPEPAPAPAAKAEPEPEAEVESEPEAEATGADAAAPAAVEEPTEGSTLESGGAAVSAAATAAAEPDEEPAEDRTRRRTRPRMRARTRSRHRRRSRSRRAAERPISRRPTSTSPRAARCSISEPY